MAQSAADRVMNGGLEIHQFPSAQLLAEAAARDWLRKIATASGPFTVALSGGRIAKDFFREIAARGRENHGLRQACFFWADERCVPPEHEESNYRVARELLFEPLGIAAGNIHRIRGEENPAGAAEQATAELLRVAGASAGQFPILDWVFLGMGEDGHVASLFPGAEAVDQVYYPVVSPKPPPRRITLGYPVLQVAREVWVLASGQGKETALRESLRPGGTTPLARVLGPRRHTRIFSDILLKTF